MKATDSTPLFLLFVLTAGTLFSGACGSSSEGAAGGKAPSPRDDSLGGDSNNLTDSPVLDGNIVANLEDKVIFRTDHATVPTTHEVLVEAHVGQQLIVEVSYLGTHNPWILTQTGFANVVSQTVITDEPGESGVTKATTSWPTANLDAGTYDIVATFDGSLVNSSVSATVTIRVTLKS